MGLEQQSMSCSVFSDTIYPRNKRIITSKYLDCNNSLEISPQSLEKYTATKISLKLFHFEYLYLPGRSNAYQVRTQPSKQRTRTFLLQDHPRKQKQQYFNIHIKFNECIDQSQYGIIILSFDLCV